MESQPPLRRNYITIAGVLIAVMSFAIGVVLLVSELVFEHRNPYAGIVTYMIVPGIMPRNL